MQRTPAAMGFAFVWKEIRNVQGHEGLCCNQANFKLSIQENHVFGGTNRSGFPSYEVAGNDTEIEVDIVEDSQIITLFYQRAEAAIARTQEKYGALCHSVACRILADVRDVEECVSDVYFRVWNAIPPDRPKSLSAYLSRITRNAALDRLDYNAAAQRSTALTCAFEELEACLPAREVSLDGVLEAQQLRQDLNGFLRAQPKQDRIFFLRRYWYGESLREIAAACHVTEAKVKKSLYRTRKRLHNFMEQEGITV